MPWQPSALGSLTASVCHSITSHTRYGYGPISWLISTPCGQTLPGKPTGAGMNVSLEQAIEIYAGVLKRRHKHHAPHIAREHARTLKYWKDHEGHDVWLRVAEAQRGF